jgi:cytochrome c biogenesis protein ResB
MIESLKFWLARELVEWGVVILIIACFVLGLVVSEVWKSRPQWMRRHGR